jgi:Zn-dependent M28 family amino/carboxypeptidase
MQNTQQSVVVGAHLDHLEPRSGKWYPGADDNASGTSVMLEVARLIAADYQSGYRPVRNIVFASFTAEEIGLLGSQFYTLNPLFSVDSTVAFINIDMVGRLSVNEQKGLHLHVNGKNRMNDFAQILNEINIDSMLFVDSKTLAGSSVYSLSDHYHYDRLGLPSYILTTGLHADYHEPTDTPEKLSYDGMGRLVKLIYNAVRHFADDSEPWVIAQ